MSEDRNLRLSPTRLDPPHADIAKTRRDAQTDEARLPLIRLPAALASRFRIVRPLTAIAGQGYVLLVEDVSGTREFVVKLYHPHVRLKRDVLDKVASANPEHVIRLFEYGESEGHWYELLEYAPYGSLRDHVREGAEPPETFAEEVVRELSTAIEHIHGRDLVHRDLKPENILVRRREPLDLVLTDFGIASEMTDETLHFTSGDRSVRYAAPEQAHGVVTRAVDYWALGMIVAEVLLGQHPFAGISERVIEVELATKPVPLSMLRGRWLLLCRGLMLRDPLRRWGVDEITRWLREDITLPVPADEGIVLGGGRAFAAQPYHFLDGCYECPVALAPALAAHWDDGIKQLARGQLGDWVYRDLRDQSLKTFIDDILLENDITMDAKLFRVLLRLAPEMKPTYKGSPVSEDGLLALAARVVEGDGRVRQVLGEIYTNRLLLVTSEVRGEPALAALDRSWRANVSECRQVIESAVPAADRSDVPSADEGEVLGPILLGMGSPEFHERMLAQALGASTEEARECEWYGALGEPKSAGVGALLALAAVAPLAARETQDRRLRERESARQAEASAAAAKLVWATVYGRKLERVVSVVIAVILLPVVTYFDAGRVMAPTAGLLEIAVHFCVLPGAVLLVAYLLAIAWVRARKLVVKQNVGYVLGVSGQLVLKIAVLIACVNTALYIIQGLVGLFGGPKQIAGDGRIVDYMLEGIVFLMALSDRQFPHGGPSS